MTSKPVCEARDVAFIEEVFRNLDIVKMIPLWGFRLVMQVLRLL